MKEEYSRNSSFGRTIEFEDRSASLQLFGVDERNLKRIQEKTGVTLSTRGTSVTLAGDEEDVRFVEKVLKQLYRLAKKGYPLYGDDLERAVDILSADGHMDLQSIFMDKVMVSVRHKVIAPRGLSQKRYIDAIRRHDIVFGVGPAGTGKTYLAMAMAVAAFMRREVKRIILTRPAVEAGEKLGFLPGDLAEKVNPYLRPLYDALHDLLDVDKTAALMEQGVIEVAPLAFMRGRTLNGAFIILDEAQNTTYEQMKMFLTRLGFDSKAVITGDVTQIDLPKDRCSGLVKACEVLEDVNGIGFSYFTDADVVRHPLVQQVVKAFEAHESKVREEQYSQGYGSHLENGSGSGLGLGSRPGPGAESGAGPALGAMGGGNGRMSQGAFAMDANEGGQGGDSSSQTGERFSEEDPDRMDPVL